MVVAYTGNKPPESSIPVALPRAEGAPPAADDGETSLIGTYLQQAMRIPLLSAEEEVELAQAWEAARQAKAELHPSSSWVRRGELEARIREGEAARQRLVESNLRLVVKVAKQRLHRGCPGLSLLDLVQEGNIGLMQAVDRFDWRLGYRFSTYAIWWIRREMERAVAECGRPIRVPLHVHDAAGKLAQTETQLIERIGRQPNRRELAKAAGLPEKKVVELRRHLQPVLSIDQTTHEDDGLRIADTVADRASTDEMESVPQSTLGTELNRLLTCLSPRERALIEMRFGLNGVCEATLEEIGMRMGISRERARQIECGALRKLNALGRRASLVDYLH